MIKEKGKELARKDRELKRMEEKMFLAQRQRDEVKERFRQKNLELYDVMTQLDEAKGKILALQARIVFTKPGSAVMPRASIRFPAWQQTSDVFFSQVLWFRSSLR